MPSAKTSGRLPGGNRWATAAGSTGQCRNTRSLHRWVVKTGDGSDGATTGKFVSGSDAVGTLRSCHAGGSALRRRPIGEHLGKRVERRARDTVGGLEVDAEREPEIGDAVDHSLVEVDQRGPLVPGFHTGEAAYE